jgi:DNA-binding SARP family transcriptional activator
MAAIGDRRVAREKVRLFLRGRAAAQLADGRRVELERKEAGLLAYLALEGVSSRSRLAGLLWPEGDEERARANLRQRLARLRRAIGEAVVDDGPGLRLAEGVILDEQAAGELLAALDYDDCSEFDQWLSRHRCATQAQDRERLLAEAQRLMDTDRFDEAVRRAEQAIAADPAAETSYRQLMKWYYLRGDSAAAVAVWDRCKDVLRREFGLTPSPQTSELGRAILQARQPPTRPCGPGSIPVTVLRPPRLIGRQAPLQKLRAAWSLGQMFVVSGEGGIGKSRLLAEFIGEDASVLICAARPGDRAAPYSTLGRLLAAANERFRPLLDPAVALDVGRLVPPLLAADRQPAALSTDADRLRFVASIESFTAACRAGGASGVVIDDLQFADNASAAVFRSLFDPSRAPHGSLRAGFSTRNDSMDAGSREFLRDLNASWHVTTVELEPLASADIGRLLASLQVSGLQTQAWVAALARHAGGNPAYLLESVKTVLADGPVSEVPSRLPLPATVEAAVGRRLDHLSPDARALAQLASVAAAAFSVPLAARALGKPPLALTPAFAELERLQILKGSAFVHDIVQEATLRSVPEAIRGLLHRTVAEHLESTSSPPGAIAQHWQACGQWAKAGACWRVAAEAATVNSRPADAGDFLWRARDCFLQCGDRAAEFDALYEYGLTSSHPEHGARLPRVIEQLHALAADDEQRLKTALVDAGFSRGFAHSYRDVDHCERSARRALELAGKLGDRSLEFEARNILAFLLYCLDRGQEAIDVIEPNGDWARAHGSAAQKIDFLDRRGAALWSAGRPLESHQCHRDSANLALESGEYSRAARSLSNLGENLGHFGRLGEASAAFGQALGTCKRLGRVTALPAFAQVFLGRVQRELGHYRAALTNLSEGLAEMRRSGIDGLVVEAESELTMTWLALGQPVHAARYSSAPAVRPPKLVQSLRTIADLHLARSQGRLRGALLADAAELARTAGSVVRIPLELEMAREKAPSQATGAYERLAREARQAGLPGFELHAQVELARALLENAQADAAAAQIRAALARLREFDPVGLYRPAVWWTAFRVLEAVGQAAAAHDCLRAGRDWIESTLRQHVPDAYRDSFLEHNPINRELLAAARAGL